MKKLHAGHYVAIFFVFFISLLVTALIASRNQDHNLVSENYYDLDLQYQQRMEAKNNIAKQPDKITLSQNNNNFVSLTIYEPHQNAKGSIKMYRPSDQTKDLAIPFIIDEMGKIEIPTENLERGRWVLIIDWIENDIPFFKEFNLYL
jgi:nitrogen fixation protein FixH